MIHELTKLHDKDGQVGRGILVWVDRLTDDSSTGKRQRAAQDAGVSR